MESGPRCPDRERLLSEQAERTLVRLDSGGFNLEAEHAATIHVVGEGEAWRVAGQGPWDGWRLAREPSERGEGWRLEAAGEWLGRTQGFPGAGDAYGMRYLLLADGRLFRMVPGQPEITRLEVRSHEAPGAWLVARRDRDRWTLSPTPAGRGDADLIKLELLLAAEIRRFEQEP